MVTQNKHEQDLRVRRTRKMLQQALIDLTIQKGFGAVTVRDLTEAAMVNRATFYRHYKDKFDLLDQYMDELYESLNRSSAARGGAESGNRRSTAGLTRMLEHVQAHADFYRAMLGRHGYPPFAQRIREYVEKRIRRGLAQSPSHTQLDAASLDLCLNYVSSASIGAIVWWLEHSMPYSPEQLADWSQRLVAADVEATIKLGLAPALTRRRRGVSAVAGGGAWEKGNRR